jgi:hypothetical protein
MKGPKKVKKDIKYHTGYIGHLRSIPYSRIM